MINREYKHDWGIITELLGYEPGCVSTIYLGTRAPVLSELIETVLGKMLYSVHPVFLAVPFLAPHPNLFI